MKRSLSLPSPVVSLFSPSPAASRKAQDLFASLFGLEGQSLDVGHDELDDSFQSRVPGFSRRWDSVALKCPSSGAVLHFCSIDSGNESKDSSSGIFSLLGITDSSLGSTTSQDVASFRNLFASHVGKQATNIKLRHSMRSLTPSHLLGSSSSGELPFLVFPVKEKCALQPEISDPSTGLKEIAVPAYDFAVYPDGSNLLTRLSSSGLPRPKTGLYEWASTRIRPLPTSSEDQRLPPPSLIFHCDSLEDVVSVEEHGATTSKIGFGGLGNGQLIVLHKDLPGLDLRYCSSTEASSSFAEAQESLLAASLADLQSTNILLGGGEKAKADERVGHGDCWVEFRANLKEPVGFWRRHVMTKSKLKHRIAKAPDLPFE
jgi:hypothetical protein